MLPKKDLRKYRDNVCNGVYPLISLHAFQAASLLKTNPVPYTSTTHFQIWQKQPLRDVLRKRCSENIQQIYRRTPMPNQLYWNHTLEWVLSWKFTAYSQNIFSQEQLWRAASDFRHVSHSHFILVDCVSLEKVKSL